MAHERCHGASLATELPRGPNSAMKGPPQRFYSVLQGLNEGLDAIVTLLHLASVWADWIKKRSEARSIHLTQMIQIKFGHHED